MALFAGVFIGYLFFRSIFLVWQAVVFETEDITTIYTGLILDLVAVITAVTALITYTVTAGI